MRNRGISPVMKTIHRTLSRRTLKWLTVTVAALAFGAVAIPSFANLSGSTFEGNDGNLVVNTAGNTDWANAPNRVVGIDQPSGSNDNAFGQGTKEDDPNVKVVTGSIPPNKNDLTRFYIGSEFASGSNFLYLAWERLVNIGNANLDLEINQNPTAGFTGTTTGPITLNRTAGDLLVTYDFSGSGTPTLGLLTWLTAAHGDSVSDCFTSNTLPCWGKHVNLSAAGAAEGAVNTVTVTDPVPPGAPRTLTTGLFGEAAINLTAAGVFPAGTCEAFGSTFLKSRASSSFGAEVKDFIAPQPVNISNCGLVTIIKHTDPRNLDQDFSYTSTVGGSTNGVSNSSPFTLNDGAGKVNTKDMQNVPAGSYTVTEGAEPANFTLESLTCTASGGGSGSQDGTNPFKANITVVPDSHVTCTYVNQGSGAILVTKTAKNHNLGSGQHPLAGATFTVNGVSKQTDANGQACFDGLTIGTAYTVTETAAPSGYAIDTASKSVTPSAPASCTSGTPAGVSFTDSPLTDVSVSATSEVPGVTNSTITCKDASNANIGNSPQGPADPVSVAANGLKPGTYTCTIDIDP
jgi:Prealbumin-like fold domain